MIQEVAPEIVDIYDIREDESEEMQVKTGRLHESRILGIMLKYYFEGKQKVTTRDVEFEYKKYFKEIARSTISTYLNMLKSENTLYKERDGRVVFYLLSENPPDGISSFWFTRLFCIDPIYFERAIYFASLYSIADKIVCEYKINEEKEKFIFNFKYLVGIITLYILKNRAMKCLTCQFGKQDRYQDLIETLDLAIKDRADVLSDDLLKELSESFSEIPTFGGINIKEEENEEK
ncbi:MAG: hypothetical protein MUP85_23785, partial [Candidatus Lokiarchaeota archaeon]|nr:hypothetical protein [Candidatus Lokiarchaeota archaeon]